MTSQEPKPVALRYLEELLCVQNAVPFIELFIPDSGSAQDDHACGYDATTNYSQPVCHKQVLTYNNYDLCFESIRRCEARVEACWKLLHTSTERSLVCTGRMVATAEGIYILRSIAGRIEEDWTACDALGLLYHLGIIREPDPG